MKPFINSKNVALHSGLAFKNTHAKGARVWRSGTQKQILLPCFFAA
jgi:hypothetical protein